MSLVNQDAVWYILYMRTGGEFRAPIQNIPEVTHQRTPSVGDEPPTVLLDGGRSRVGKGRMAVAALAGGAIFLTSGCTDGISSDPEPVPSMPPLL